MKRTLIVLVVGLLAVGCATLTPEQKLRDSIVGEYEANENGITYKQVLLENGIAQGYKRGEKHRVYKWTIENGELLLTEVMRHGDIRVFRINTDKSITLIADIEDGKRTDWSEERQGTMEKIK